MSRYTSINCPVCNKPLDNGEDVVVCPVCGAPYHKSCYAKTGECIFTDLHKEGKAWEAPKPHEETQDSQNQSNANGDTIICPRCGAQNPSSGIFCNICGTPLNQNNQSQQEPNFGSFTQGSPFPPNGMPFTIFVNPYGGVAPDEEIDGVPAKDLATFVGRNSQYFLPKFKAISEHKAKTLNWSAFFFQGGYFLYRKMYALAILLIIITGILSVPGMLSTYQLYCKSLGYAGFSFDSSSLELLSFICSVLSIALRFICGFIANSYYKAHAVKIIKREKALNPDPEVYTKAIAKKGSVAIKLITVLLIVYVTLQVVSMYALIILGI